MKDTPDRPDEPLPARRSLLPPVASLAPKEHYDEFADQPAAPASGKRVSFRLVSRALRRFWWQTILVWLVGSISLMALAYAKINPTFDAASQVRIEVERDNVLATLSGPIDLSQYMQTQVAKITSPTILGSALVETPKLRTYPLLQGAEEPEAELRSALRVAIVPRTNLIQVEMSSAIPAESADMVNAVVKAYLDHSQLFNDETTQKQIKRYQSIRDSQRIVVDKQRKVIEDLNQAIDVADEIGARDRNSTSIEAYRRWNEQLTEVEIRVIAAENKLNELRLQKTQPVRPLDDKAMEEEIVRLFYDSPRVMQVEADLKRATDKLKDVERIARRDDPSVRKARERLEAITNDKNELWQKLEPVLRRQLSAAPTDETLERSIKEAEDNLASVKTHKDALQKKLDEVKVESSSNHNKALKGAFAQRDLQREEDVLDKVNRSLEQLELDARNPIARVNLEFPAKASSKPNADRRTQLMAASPFALGMLLLSLLVLFELRAARVSDPEELTRRMKLQVIGVVPPLPQIRAGATFHTNGNGNGTGGSLPAMNGDLRAQRQLDEFVQSLDHLRVALCARPDPWGRDRHCVLITSACGSEGKTTLAAQLAERCVNAGMMTLLIDGDLRNPTLSRMLDAQDSPGLINVLRGEMSAEDVVTVISDAGGFHLLPAGTPRMDPSRLLQNGRLGKLLAQARESFDMIIVDAPPVLPVPDALTMGRWTDGAVLAVRYDTSRFPLVERANRRLAHVGVPVIGAVVNGVRSSDSYYGSYGYGGYGGYGSSYGTNYSEEPSPVAPTSPVVDGGLAQPSA